MNFEAYLSSKKIDSAAFKKAEPVLWDAWRKEFEELHPNSFTAQKLYLINPLRRKYHQAIEALPEVLKSVENKLPVPPVTTAATPAQGTDTESKPKPVVARPMMKPKLPTSAPASGEVTPAATQQASASTTSTPPAKPAVAKPVMSKPVIKPKPVAEESINSESIPPADANAIAPRTDSKTEQAPVSKPMAKPVIPRPVIKPQPVTEQSIHEGNIPATANPAAIAPTDSKTEQPPASKPMAKPVIPRPVIKPKIPAPETEKQPQQTTEPLHDNTPANTPPAQPNETPPAKAVKPAIPRPVIKPPKPKTD